MIKCPNCGSTAQVKITHIEKGIAWHGTFTKYLCGCGCNFQITEHANGKSEGKWKMENGKFKEG